MSDRGPLSRFKPNPDPQSVFKASSIVPNDEVKTSSFHNIYCNDEVFTLSGISSSLKALFAILGPKTIPALKQKAINYENKL